MDISRFYAVNTCAAAFYYADSVRHAILLCKENGNPWYARELADLMAVLIFDAQPARAPGYRPVYENLSDISLYSAIVPVPPRVKTVSYTHLTLPTNSRV